MEAITTEAGKYPDLSARYYKFREYASKSLWHQLTLELLDFVRNASNRRGDNLITLYNSFIANYEQKLDQLKLINIATEVSTQFYKNEALTSNDIKAASDFLLSFKNKKFINSPTAVVVVEMELISLKQKEASLIGREKNTEAVEMLNECKRELNASKAKIDELPDATDPIVIGTYYRVLSEFYKLRGPAQDYFESALLYLGACPLESLPLPVQNQLAIDIATAALVSEGVFNFGEVNAQPVLKSLAGTPNAWMMDLLSTFQTGDIDAFTSVMSLNKSNIAKIPALASSEKIIKEKIILLALLQLAASKPPVERVFDFADIAAAVRLPIEEVDWLLMRAFSLNILSGSMDEVQQTVKITDIKPRVLDLSQISQLKDAIVEWRDKAKSTLTFMEESTNELLS